MKLMDDQMDKAIKRMPFIYRFIYNFSFVIYLLFWGSGYFVILQYLADNWGINNFVSIFGAAILTFIPVVGSITAAWASHVTSLQYPIWAGVIQFIVFPIGAKLIRNYVQKKALFEFGEIDER